MQKFHDSVDTKRKNVEVGKLVKEIIILHDIGSFNKPSYYDFFVATSIQIREKWMEPMIRYLKEGLPPNSPVDAHKIEI